MKKIILHGEEVEIPTWQDRMAAYDRNTSKRDAEHFRKIMAMSPEELNAQNAEAMAEIEKRWKGSEERLAYYRSHGLVDCNDYPGGDEAFEKDVLSGEQREETAFHFKFKREDAYIYKCIKNGKFKVDFDFCRNFRMHPRVGLFVDNMLDVIVQGPYDYERQILSPDSDLYKRD